MKRKGLVILAICSILTQVVGSVSASDEIGIVHEEIFNEEVDTAGFEENCTESMEAGADDFNLEEPVSEELIPEEEKLFEIDAVSEVETAEEEEEGAWESPDEEEYEVGEEVFPEEELFDAFSEEAADAADASAEAEMPLAGESWGNNLKWSLAGGVLTISGRGNMSVCDDLGEDYEEKDTNLFPWGKLVNLIKKVIIEDEVTSISPAAFFGCEALTEVTIGKNVSIIGEQAFRNAVNLKKVTFEAVKAEKLQLEEMSLSELRRELLRIQNMPELTIGKWAFDGCESIRELILPKKTTEIGEGTFDGCFSLEDIYLGSAKRPMFNTYFISNSEAVWTVYSVNGEIYAYPASYMLETNPTKEVLVSETDQITSYDDVTNKFFVTIPDSSKVAVKVVDRIDADTLNALTYDELGKL